MTGHRILADVPCSASGVIRRHPDIKLLRRDDDIPNLVLQQKAILSALWPLLKPGGVMIYSTCSIFKDENEAQIAWFIGNHENCTVNRLNSVQWGHKRPYGRQIFPGQHGMDGFYYAKIHKTMMMSGQKD
jgi:16S rRNA (cytosine967-C5)-methyltransferase